MLDTTRDGDPPLTATFKAIAPALVAFLLALAALVPAALTVPVHEDERQYVWTGAYYFGKLTHLDFRTTGSDSYTDPGWAPVDFWPLTQPMGTRFVFGTAMAVAGVPAPALPYSYGDAALQGPATEIPAETLPVVRLAAVLCAALGFALVAKRLGWRGTAAAALVLAMPFSREDLARAWAEGPLMLGLGLCTLAYGTRWFSPACGVAATFKLTALGLWPLALLKAANGGRYGALGIPIAAVVWSALTPSSWFLLGPVYLLPMLADRFVEYRSASQTYPGPFGIYFPTRYLVPFELLFALGIVWLAPRAWQRLPARLRGVGTRCLRAATERPRRRLPHPPAPLHAVERGVGRGRTVPPLHRVERGREGEVASDEIHVPG